MHESEDAREDLREFLSKELCGPELFIVLVKIKFDAKVKAKRHNLFPL